MKLEHFAAPKAAAADGLWVKPGADYGDLELKVRPYTEEYNSHLSRVQNEAVRRARMDGRLKPRETFEDLPLAHRLALAREQLLERLVVDVRGVEDEHGTPLTIARYRELAMDIDTYQMLSDAAFEAVTQVTTDRKALRDAAGGNSAPSSVKHLSPE